MCHYAMEVFRILGGRIGVPLGPEKTVGPATQLIYLGFELCVPEMLARIPQDKLVKYTVVIQHFMQVSQVYSEGVPNIDWSSPVGDGHHCSRDAFYK